MKTTLLVTSGTGNSLWVARCLAERLGDTELRPLVPAGGAPISSEAVGLVFPVHIWGLPKRVIDWVHGLTTRPAYLFAVAVNAGQVAATLLQLDRLLRARSLTLSSGFSVVMPSNYLPWGGAAPVDAQRALFERAEARIERIAALVGRRELCTPEKGPLWQNLLFSLIYKRSFPYVPTMDRKFWVDEKCNSCGVCERICPAGNVELEGGRPVWLHRCEQCLACIQWCPQEAIQYGKKTPGYRRYRHPEVSLPEMLRLNRGEGSRADEAR